MEGACACAGAPRVGNADEVGGGGVEVMGHVLLEEAPPSSVDLQTLVFKRAVGADHEEFHFRTM